MVNLPTSRQLKVGETIKRELSQIFLKELSDPFFEALFITVSEVKMSPDLKYAEVYIVPMSGKSIEKEEIFKSLTEKSHKMRSLLNKRLKLRFSPELKFKYDDSFEKAQKLNLLLDE